MVKAARQVALFLRRVIAIFGWTRSSSVLLGGFFLICGMIIYVWWPLAQEALVFVDWNGPWWLYIDWLLLGVFAFMTLTIIAHAKLGRDAMIVLVGMFGGLVIEFWGTQTNLWHYFTAERPPLWIIPAWPIASLSIDRITRILIYITNWVTESLKSMNKSVYVTLVFRISYWIIFIGFYAMMLNFVTPTLNSSYTILALLLVALITLTPTDHRYSVLTFLAGTGLGYCLELWGTTRQCWTYYTFQTPPFFAVLAHGLAAVAFWRAGLLIKLAWEKLATLIFMKFRNSPSPEIEQ